VTGSRDIPVAHHSDPDFPVALILAGRRCLVVGGGPVAARKTRGLVEAGGRVTVVAPQMVAAMEALAGVVGTGVSVGDGVSAGGRVALERRPYRSGEAARYDLVVTATGVPSVDGEVAADARGGGVLVDSADSDIPGTIRLPAVIRLGTVTVAVSTGGSSPALARWLRDRIAASLPPGIDTVATLIDEARRDMRAAGRSTGSVAWSGLLDRVVPLVVAGRIDEARDLLRAACSGH
jgi:precorrin-2 dehydrogenase / sirohydrochlorin ferrochelatase